MTTAALDTATALLRTGIVLSGALAQTPTGDDKFANNGKQYLALENSSGSPVTITFVTPTVKDPTDTVGALAVQDPTATIDDGETKIFGPFKPSVWNDASGYVSFTLSDATDMTADVFQMNNYGASE